MPERARRARRPGQSYSLAKYGARRARTPVPALGGAGSQPVSAPLGIAATAATAATSTTAAATAAADFLARGKLWPRFHFSTAPAAFLGESQDQIA